MKLIAGLLIIACSLLRPLLAENQTLTLRAEVLDSAPCTLQDSPLTISFGPVPRDKLDGSRFSQPINYRFNCTLNAEDKTLLSLAIRGTAADFDSSALATNKPGLAVRLTRSDNGNPFPVNRWINFTYPDFPGIQAVVVARPNFTPDSGPFSASATLLIAYQ